MNGRVVAQWGDYRLVRGDEGGFVYGSGYRPDIVLERRNYDAAGGDCWQKSDNPMGALADLADRCANEWLKVVDIRPGGKEKKP